MKVFKKNNFIKGIITGALFSVPFIILTILSDFMYFVMSFFSPIVCINSNYFLCNCWIIILDIQENECVKIYQWILFLSDFNISFTY